MQNIEQKYTQLLQKYTEELNQIKRKNYWVSAARLLIFLLVVALSIFFADKNFSFIGRILLISFIPFLFLIKLNTKYLEQIKLLKELIKINKNELEAIKGNLSLFPSGAEYIDYEHSYTYDMDIFGEASVFQAMNRSCTKGGADKLADFLKNSLLDKKQIFDRQEAIKELSGKLDWRQNFQATGNSVLENEEDTSNTAWFIRKSSFKNDKAFHQELMDWINEEVYFSKIKIFPFLLIALPLIAFTALLFTVSGKFPFMGLVLVVLALLGFVGFFNKKITNIHARIGSKVNIWKKYEKLLKIIEKNKFEATLLNNLLKETQVGNNKASQEVMHLKKLAKALDNRLNLVFIFLANGFLLWDLQVVFRLEKWRIKNKNHIKKWFESIYTFDALSGFASFAYNNPDFVMPEPQEGDFILKIKQGGHPLLEKNKRIDNDFTIQGYGQIRIITGANMAGKSTFLRTVGVNLILAMAGSVVCAQKFSFMPIHLHTSVRTDDSLQKNESYFFAELKRLQSIIKRLEKGEKLFVIIDEMLRGTNSKDKHLGSAALIERLIDLQAIGLVATHDIELGKMTQKYPENIENHRFEVDIKNDELYFDYKIKTGISQNLNAMFLMKKMGIVQ